MKISTKKKNEEPNYVGGLSAAVFGPEDLRLTLKEIVVPAVVSIHRKSKRKGRFWMDFDLFLVLFVLPELWQIYLAAILFRNAFLKCKKSEV